MQILSQWAKWIVISPRKTLPISVSFLSLLAFAQSASAADYLACREMLRTKNEAIHSSVSSSAYSSTHSAMRRYLEQVNARKDCEKKYQSTSNYVSPQELGLISACVDSFTDQRKRYWDGVALQQEQDRQRVEQKLNKTLTKIKRDMKKAGCPYE